MSRLNEQNYIYSLLSTRPRQKPGKAAKLWPSLEHLDSKIGLWMLSTSNLQYSRAQNAPQTPAKPDF